MEKTMNLKKLLLAVSAAAVLSATGATVAQAADWHHPAHPVVVRHDRYWRPGFRDGVYIGRDRIFDGLRAHGYVRWVGDPYWYNGYYGVRCYDRFGHIVFCEVNPYSGLFVGVIHL
jgi:hypothetical protein